MGALLNASGGGSSPEIIAAAVWDKMLIDHASPGTAGATMTEAKLKAALAAVLSA